MQVLSPQKMLQGWHEEGGSTGKKNRTMFLYKDPRYESFNYSIPISRGFLYTYKEI